MLLGPNIWGPHLWQALHMISIGYPNEPNDNQKQNYKKFFENFYQVIPCAICSNNYKKHLEELPITDEIMKNRQNLSKWVIDIHNIVNKEQGKNIIEPDDALVLIFNNFNNPQEYITKSKIVSNSKQNEITKLFSTPYSLCLLIFILFVLVSIAIIYKKK
jgi:hypothetical protein